jgi:4-amino-4-deoxy-L-arabinose transferase-like glycosyltransferase
VRAPSIIAGTLLVPLLYAAGRDLYHERAGIAAAVFGAVAPFAVWYSQEGRMYAFFMVFALLAVWMQLRAVRDGRPRDWALYTIASALLVWNQYFGAFVVLVQQAAFAGFAITHRREGRPLRPYLIAWGASALALLVMVAPLVPFALDQFQANEAAGKGFNQATSQAGAGATQQAAGPSIYGAITNMVWALWGYHSDSTMTAIAALWPFAILLALALLGRDRSPATRLVVAVAILPALALFGVGQLKPFVFEVRYFIGAVPLLLLWVGRTVTSWPASRTGGLVAAAAVFATLAMGSADQQLNGTNPRTYDFDGAMTEVQKRARPGDTVVYSPKDIQNIVVYYGDGIKVSAPGGPPPARRKSRVFVVATFLEKPEVRRSTAQTIERLRKDRKVVSTFERTHVKVWELQ